MNSQTKIMKVEQALTSIEGLRVSHYLRPQLQPPFCVWQEDGEASSLQGDNHKGEQAISGTVDYFTQTEYDPMIDTIQDVLNATEGLGWSMSSVQYEDETDLIHYEWNWSVL